MARTKHMKDLDQMLAEKRQQLDRLHVEIATLEALRRRTTGESEIDPGFKRGRRSNVKRLVLDLLREVGERGLNATIAVEMAAKRAQHLERGTVSSLLSRLKSEGIVTYDDTFYRLVRKPDTPAIKETEKEFVH